MDPGTWNFGVPGPGPDLMTVDPSIAGRGRRDGVIVVGFRGRQRRVVQGELGGDTPARVVPAPSARRRRSRV
jgi:hypothetical protein